MQSNCDHTAGGPELRQEITARMIDNLQEETEGEDLYLASQTQAHSATIGR
jgi:hypothetical protein